LAYGIGLALVVDEAALLIELKDVYWNHQGGISVAIAITLIGGASPCPSPPTVRREHRTRTEAIP
jgi:hypothetical protein